MWVLPGEINAMMNCADCYKGLATLSGEVDVRFIAHILDGASWRRANIFGAPFCPNYL